MRITSLGKKKPTTAPPKKAAAPPPEDDIFASMGLAAKPKFSHAPAPASRPVSSTASRWTNTTTTATALPSAHKTAPALGTTQNVSSTPASSTAFTASASGGDDDADWGDDADLDDLLDD
jgi:hypothetical protein